MLRAFSPAQLSLAPRRPLSPTCSLALVLVHSRLAPSISPRGRPFRFPPSLCPSAWRAFPTPPSRPPAREVYSRNLAFYVYEFLVDFGNAVNSQVTQTTLLEDGRGLSFLTFGSLSGALRELEDQWGSDGARARAAQGSRPPSPHLPQ